MFQLCPGWAIGYDPLQWMLLRANKRLGKSEWHPVSFIASRKRVLRRAIAENGIEPDSEAQAQLDAMPETFRAWYRRQNRRGIPFLEREAA